MATEEFNQLLNGSSSRLTNHPEDNDVAERLSSTHLSSDEDDRAPAATQHPEDDNEPLSSRPYNTVVPQRRYQANTGPKGVIADAQKFREARRGVNGAQRMNGGSGIAQQEDKDAGKKFGDREKAEKGERSDDDFDGLDDDEDDEFMARWRSSRMQEMRKGGASAYKTQTTQRGARTYGSLSTVDAAGYLHAVDHSPPGTLVLVYIYDDDSDVSIAIEEALRDLAQMRPSVRFVRLHFVEAEMEPAGVPALLAYVDGEKFAGLVPVVDELPDEGELSAETLEGVLRRHRILR
ncbi:phosducin [Neohortaea acidophila]|uniref:Phosducin n=1 Tax=Neohortaea acidophila TaxID=245834 RepID=A0A6A6Q2W5_9PEZI|nr:phosducin [Neohortaea acidophila]KAF2486334.1 phosducin [Neohortaea acidophila]